MAITGDKNQIIRRKAIMGMLDDDIPLKVSVLKERFNVSAVTIRKDLDALEDAGLVSRTHGGAVKVVVTQSVPDYEARKLLRTEEKVRIAKAAAELVQSGESLILNVGSTSAFLCEELKQIDNLIVVTNALQNAMTFLPHKNITTFLLGGRIDSTMQITLGNEVEDQLSKYKADWLFMGVDGVDIDAGVTSYNHLEDSVMNLMISKANKRVLIVDDSKIGRVTFARIASVTDFDIIITNYSERNKAHYAELEAAGLELIIV